MWRVSVGFGYETEGMGAWGAVDKAGTGMLCGVDVVKEMGGFHARAAGMSTALVMIMRRNKMDKFARGKKERCNAWG